MFDVVRSKVVRPILRPDVLFWCCVSVFLTLSGPFGTYLAMSWWVRAAFWTLVLLAALLIGNAARRIARHYAGEDHPRLCDVIVVATNAVFLTPVLSLISNVFFSFSERASPATGTLLIYVVAVSVIISLMRVLIPEIDGMLLFGRAAAPDPPRLVRRLPADFRGPILRLSVRDHFVDVVTAHATHTIRLRFADAIDEMDTVTGYCTHRSHWVTQSAITSVERENGRIHLRLVNDDKVPVSRKYRPALEQAGIV